MAEVVDGAGNTSSGPAYSFEFLGPSLSPEFLASEADRLSRRRWMSRTLVALLSMIVAMVGYVTLPRFGLMARRRMRTGKG